MQPFSTTSAPVPARSRLGMGCAEIGNLYRTVSEGEARAVLEAAVALGITLFDTAPGYGNGLSELRTGAFVRDNPGAGLCLSTKVGRYLLPGRGRRERDFFAAPLPFEGRFDYGYGGIMRSFEQSLLRLGVTSVDRLFVHDLDVGNQGGGFGAHHRALIEGGLRALDELRKAGDTRQIGVAVNEPEVGVQMLRDGAFDVALLASRYTLLDQSALDGFLPLARARGVAVIVGGVFNSGILATGATPGARYDYREAGSDVSARVAAIEAVCRRHAVPLAAAALQFALAHPAVEMAFVGTARAGRIADNIAAIAQPIPAALWAELREAGLLRVDAPVPPV